VIWQLVAVGLIATNPMTLALADVSDVARTTVSFAETLTGSPTFNPARQVNVLLEYW